MLYLISVWALKVSINISHLPPSKKSYSWQPVGNTMAVSLSPHQLRHNPLLVPNGQLQSYCMPAFFLPIFTLTTLLFITATPRHFTSTVVHDKPDHEVSS